MFWLWTRTPSEREPKPQKLPPPQQSIHTEPQLCLHGGGNKNTEKNVSQIPVRVLESEQRPAQVHTEPQRMVQLEACDKNTDTPLELFGT